MRRLLDKKKCIGPKMEKFSGHLKRPSTMILNYTKRPILDDKVPISSFSW